MPKDKSVSKYWVLDGVVKEFATKEEMQFFLDESGLTILDETTRQVVKISSLTPGGMSDAAIESANEQADKEIVWMKSFRFTPTSLSADILQRTVESSRFDKSDIVNIALFMLQNASMESITIAIDSLSVSKAESLFNSLK